MPFIIGFSIIAGGILILWSSKTEDSKDAALPSNTNPVEGFDIQKMRAARKELRRQQNLRKKTSNGGGSPGDGEAE